MSTWKGNKIQEVFFIRSEAGVCAGKKNTWFPQWKFKVMSCLLPAPWCQPLLGQSGDSPVVVKCLTRRFCYCIFHMRKANSRIFQNKMKTHTSLRFWGKAVLRSLSLRGWDNPSYQSWECVVWFDWQWPANISKQHVLGYLLLHWVKN